MSARLWGKSSSQFLTPRRRRRNFPVCPSLAARTGERESCAHYIISRLNWVLQVRKEMSCFQKKELDFFFFFFFSFPLSALKRPSKLMLKDRTPPHLLMLPRNRGLLPHKLIVAQLLPKAENYISFTFFVILSFLLFSPTSATWPNNLHLSSSKSIDPRILYF